MKENFTYDQLTCPTATALVGLSHRGSRVETHAAAANRKIRRREASQCGQPYGGPLGVFAVVEKENGAENLHYVLKDHLGSWTTITNANGTVEREQSFDAWGNMRDPDTWTAYTAPEPVEGPMLDRGFTGHEHLYNFGLINMNGRMYDPMMSSFLSVDNYVQAPDFSQNFNRYAYCLNNPLKYTDPDGESFIAAMLIAGTILGVYTGGVLANNDCNPINWDFGSCKTWGYMLFGGLTGLASAYVGIAVAGADFVMCNTAAIASASLVNSVGTWFYTGGQTDITISLGVVSYNFMKREFGYLGKEGNSIFENIGYGLGAFYNLADFYRLITWDALTYSEKCDKLLEATGQTDGDCLNYDATLSDNAAYNPNDNTIKIGETGLNRGRGWAKSSIMHEWDHFERYDYQAMMDGSPYMDENVLDFYAYQTEVNNVLNNGLSWREYNEVLSKTRYYLSQGGLYIPDPMAGFSNSFSSSYTLKMYLSWIRSFFIF
jgi:RHS repeat-associated protein